MKPLLIAITLTLVLPAGCRRAAEPGDKDEARASTPAKAVTAAAIDQPALPLQAREGDVEAAAKYELGPRVTAMTQELAGAVEANTADCDKMAEAVSGVLESRGDLLLEVQATRGSREQRAWTRINAADIDSMTAKLEKMTPCLDKSPKLLDALAAML